MKRPFINQFERLMIRAGTLTGDGLVLRIAIEKLKRAIKRKFCYERRR